MKNETNKAKELFYSLIFNKEFLEDIHLFRLIFNIPIGGFSSQDHYKRYLSSLEKTTISLSEFQLKEREILKKYKIPQTPNFLSLLKNYIILGDYFDKIKEKVSSVGFLIELPSRDGVIENGQSYVKLIIPEMASRDDVLQYIKSNWKNIKSEIKRCAVYSPLKRISPFKDKNLVMACVRLNECSINFLPQLLKDKSKKYRYKNQVIAAILKEWGYKNVTPNSVKSNLGRVKAKFR